MKTLITYQTRNGATEKYMNWLAGELNCDICKFEKTSRHFDFSPYDTVVVGSGTYAGFMPLKRYLKRHWEQLKGKKVVAVAVGAAPADDPWSIRSFKKIPEKIRNEITYFKLMGESLGKEAKEKPSDVKKEKLKPVLAAILNK